MRGIKFDLSARFLVGWQLVAAVYLFFVAADGYRTSGSFGLLGYALLFCSVAFQVNCSLVLGSRDSRRVLWTSSGAVMLLCLMGVLLPHLPNIVLVLTGIMVAVSVLMAVTHPHAFLVKKK